ncbi:MAG: cytochrome c biogenesis CcdA family protein [Anaerolineales bacterium]
MADFEKDSWLARLAQFLFPAVIVIGLVLFLIDIQASAESAAANVVRALPVGFAFAAGMVASVNPCGFLLLPTYISYQLGLSKEDVEQPGWPSRLGRALSFGLMATLGFVVVSGAAGLVIAAGGQWLIRVFPYAGLVVGGVMILLGGWLIVGGGQISVLAASRLSINPERSMLNTFLFGIVYAVGSLSCTLPIFLAVVGSGLATQGLGNSLLQFISYALGMGLVLIAVALASALLRSTFITWLRRAVPYIERASAMFLIGAGVYLLYYWIFFADAIL